MKGKTLPFQAQVVLLSFQERGLLHSELGQTMQASFLEAAQALGIIFLSSHEVKTQRRDIQ